MRRPMKVLLAASFLASFGLGMFGPIYAIYVKEIGGDILDASLAWAAFTFVTGALTIILGRMEDKVFDKKKIIVFGYFLLAMASLGYYFVRSPIDLLYIQVVLGIGFAIIGPAWDAIYSLSLDKGKESFEWSLWEGGSNIILAASAVAGGLIVTFYGFHTLFLGMFVINIFGVFAAMQLEKRKK